MESDQVRAAIQPMLDKIKNESFVKTYKATDEEAMGLLLSKFAQWDGLFILRAAQYGLEDANFHGESETVCEMADRIEGAEFGKPDSDDSAKAQEA